MNIASLSTKAYGALVVSALVLSACGNSSTQDSEGITTAPASSTHNAEPIEPSRFFAAGASSDLLSVYWIEYSDFQEFAAATDVVFVGQILGTETDFVVDGPDPEDHGVQSSFTMGSRLMSLMSLAGKE